MRRYFVDQKCLWCGKKVRLEEVLVTFHRHSVVISLCSNDCLEGLQASFANGKGRKHFATLLGRMSSSAL